VKLYTYKTAAAVLDCSASKVQKMVLAGELPFLKVGNETRIREEDLRDWIDSQIRRNCSDDNPKQPLPTEKMVHVSSK
jgi:excisionase family DNA binding protein